MILSYAQNGEDVVLHRVFADQEPGFYVDIGACHPIEDSVTFHFYERGWRGVNVEPDHDLHAAFLQDRPRDINLMAAIGRTRGQVSFYPTGTRGHGTLDADLAAERTAGRGVERVPLIPLSDVIDCYGPDHGEIAFLKIDVEGWEAEVIASGDWARHRPRILVIEAVDDHGHPTHQAWEPALLDADYRFGMFDGLNRFYCRAEDTELLLPRLNAPANVRDDWRRIGDARAHTQLAHLHAEFTATQRMATEAEDRSEALGIDLEEARASEHAAHERAEAAVLETERLHDELTKAREAMRPPGAASWGTQRLLTSGGERGISFALPADDASVAEAPHPRAEAAGDLRRDQATEAGEPGLETDMARRKGALLEPPPDDSLVVEASRARAAAAAALRREEAAEARMAILEMELVRRDAADRAQRTANIQAAAWVAAVQSSTSWRVTAPLRAISLMLRGRRGRR